MHVESLVAYLPRVQRIIVITIICIVKIKKMIRINESYRPYREKKMFYLMVGRIRHRIGDTTPISRILVSPLSLSLDTSLTEFTFDWLIAVYNTGYIRDGYNNADVSVLLSRHFSPPVRKTWEYTRNVCWYSRNWPSRGEKFSLYPDGPGSWRRTCASRT